MKPSFKASTMEHDGTFRNFLDIFLLKRTNLLGKCIDTIRNDGGTGHFPDGQHGGEGGNRPGPAGAGLDDSNQSTVMVSIDLPACRNMSKPLCVLPVGTPGRASQEQWNHRRLIPRGYMLRGRVPVITHALNLAIGTSNVQDRLGLK
jgi:hypothetical protein